MIQIHKSSIKHMGRYKIPKLKQTKKTNMNDTEKCYRKSKVLIKISFCVKKQKNFAWPNKQPMQEKKRNPTKNFNILKTLLDLSNYNTFVLNI